MSNTNKWVAGAIGTPSAFSAHFNAGADLNTLSSGSWVLDTTGAVANGTNLDLYMDVSFLLASVTTGSGSPFMALYLLPLNEDGTHYGDGSASGSTLPMASYLVGTVLVPASTTAAIYGYFRGIVLPPVDFKLGFLNQGGVTTAGSGNACKIFTYNETNNG